MGHSAVAPDALSTAVAAIEELEAEFGLRVLIEAVSRSTVAAHLPSDPDKTRRVTQYVLRSIVFSPTPQLEAEIMAIGAGVLDETGIMTRVAGKHGVTRQAISKRVVAFCDEWKLPPAPAMKSDAARETYAARNQSRIPSP